MSSDSSSYPFDQGIAAQRDHQASERGATNADALPAPREEEVALLGDLDLAWPTSDQATECAETDDARAARIARLWEQPISLYRRTPAVDSLPSASALAEASCNETSAEYVNTSRVEVDPLKHAETATAPAPSKLLGEYIRPHRLNRVSGLEGIGKTLVTHDLAARCSTGSAVLDFEHFAPGNVLYLTSSEDGLGTHEDRLRAANADRGRIELFDDAMVLKANEQWLATPRSADEDIDFFRGYIRQRQIGLVVLNPGYTFLSTSNRRNAIDEDLDRWSRIAEEDRVTVLVIDYEGPNHQGLSALSSRLRKKARASLIVEPVPHGAPNERLLRLDKANDVSDEVKRAALKFRIVGVDGVPKIEWLGPVDLKASRNHARRGPRPRKRQAAAAWLKDYVGTGRVRSHVALDAAKKAGHSQATIYRALDEAGVVPEDVDRGPGAWWRLAPYD